MSDHEALKRPDLKLGHRSMARVAESSWPGNVRELQNLIERAVIWHDPTS